MEWTDPPRGREYSGERPADPPLGQGGILYDRPAVPGTERGVFCSPDPPTPTTYYIDWVDGPADPYNLLH